MVFAQVKWLHFGSRLALAKIALWSETLRENLSVTIYSYIHTIYSYIYILGVAFGHLLFLFLARRSDLWFGFSQLFLACAKANPDKRIKPTRRGKPEKDKNYSMLYYSIYGSTQAQN